MTLWIEAAEAVRALHERLGLPRAALLIVGPDGGRVEAPHTIDLGDLDQIIVAVSRILANPTPMPGPGGSYVWTLW